MKKNIKQNTDIEKRKAFNFLRSYYDVLDDIHSNEDKLTYLLAILDKQFKGIEPELKGIPRLCYNGQRHSIDSSRKGWEDKVGYEPPTLTIGGSQGGLIGGMGYPTLTIDPSPQEKEKEQEKEQEQEKVKKEINNKNLILEDERFYNHNLREIHHIMDSFNVSKKEAIEIHKEVIDAMSSVFK